MGKEVDEYILGTDKDELHRLGLQHQIWASEAQYGWKSAGFNVGDTLLDLGSGPGFCSKELAYLVGNKGKVMAVDKSQNYIDFIDQTAKLHAINIEAVCADFKDLELSDHSLDGMFCRWALAWAPNPEEILTKVYKALKPGGKMVIQEYFDWSTHQTFPNFPHLDKAIAACLKSFKEQPGDIDVGRDIPDMLNKLGMKLTTRPLVKLVRPEDQGWQWPRSFYSIYFPKLVEMGYLSPNEGNQALIDIETLENDQTGHILCPTLIEIIAEK